MANKVKAIAAGAFKWLKKPWEITGPVSTKEYMDPLPGATEYRKHAPATQLQRVLIPHAEPEHVFDIKYYVRDRRRTPPTTTILEMSPFEELEGPAPAVSKWYNMGKDMPMSDEPGDGYQK